MLIGADSGTAYPVEPPCIASRLPYPRPAPNRCATGGEVIATGEDFDQTGIELPPAPDNTAEATWQGELFAEDYSEPDAADGEPVFWSGGAEQHQPADDYVQADAPAFS